MLFLSRWIGQGRGWQGLVNWPLADIGSAMFTTGLLGVALQYLEKQDGEVRDTERLKRVLADSTPAMRDAVIQGFAFEPDDLARVAAPATLDKIISNGLAIRLDDATFADEIYSDLRRQAIDMPERLHNARIAVRLSAQTKPATSSSKPVFIATVRWEYRLTPVYETRRFTCLSDLAEYRELRHDTAANSAWYISPRSGLDASSDDTFALLDFTVDGQPLPIRRTSKKAGQTYSVSLASAERDDGKPVEVAYTYRAKLPVADGLLRLRVDQPTRGLSVELDYTDTALEHISVLDYIASGEATRIARGPTGTPGKLISVDFPGWVFPRSGLAFVWAPPSLVKPHK